MRESQEVIRDNLNNLPHQMSLQNFQLGGRYQIFNCIAKGKNSTIYYGLHEKSKQERAFKFYNFKQIQQEKGFREKEICKRISKQEHDIMKSCKSINIVGCIDIYENRDYKVLVSEYCQDNLQKEIQNRYCKQISQIRSILILRQIISALKNLHKGTEDIQIQLQPKHILIRNGIYKLNNFGVESEQSSEYLMAPQIRRRISYDSKAEVWSIGLLFHYILFGQLPKYLQDKGKDTISYQDHSLFVIEKNYKKIKIQVSNFLTECLRIDSSERLSWKQMENHSMFNDLSGIIRSPKLKNETTLMSVILPLEQEYQYDQQDRQTYEQKEQNIFFLNKKWNLDEKRKKISKYIQVPYFKVGDPFEIKKIDSTGIDFLKNQVNKEQEMYYKQIKNFYLQCLKVEFIYNYIIQLFPQSKERQFVELINLIVGSCFTNMSRLRSLQIKKNKQSNYQNLLESCLSKSTASLYQIIQSTWKKQSDLLTKIQNKKLNMFLDKVRSITNKQQQDRKFKFLNGIENIDFDTQEKIFFTKQYYLKNRKAIQQYFSDNVLNKQTFEYLDYYDQIWRIKPSADIEERYVSLKDYVDLEILKKYSSIIDQ